MPVCTVKLVSIIDIKSIHIAIQRICPVGESIHSFIASTFTPLLSLSEKKIIVVFLSCWFYSIHVIHVCTHCFAYTYTWLYFFMLHYYFNQSANNHQPPCRLITDIVETCCAGYWNSVKNHNQTKIHFCLPRTWIHSRMEGESKSGNVVYVRFLW